MNLVDQIGRSGSTLAEIFSGSPNKALDHQNIERLDFQDILVR